MTSLYKIEELGFDDIVPHMETMQEWITFHNKYDVIDLYGNYIANKSLMIQYDLKHIIRDQSYYYSISKGCDKIGFFFIRQKEMTNCDSLVSNAFPIFAPNTDWFTMISEMLEVIKYKNRKVRFATLCGITMGHHSIMRSILSDYYRELGCFCHNDPHCASGAKNKFYLFRLRRDYDKPFKMTLKILTGSRGKEQVQTIQTYATAIRVDGVIQLIFDPIVIYKPRVQHWSFLFSLDNNHYKYCDCYTNDVTCCKLSYDYRDLNDLSLIGSPIEASIRDPMGYNTPYIISGIYSPHNKSHTSSRLNNFLCGFVAKEVTRHSFLDTPPITLQSFDFLETYNTYSLFDHKDKPYREPKKSSKVGSADTSPKKESKVGISDLLVSYIYLIRKREFLKTDDPIYKIGRTTQEPNIRIRRLESGYDKGSEIILLLKVPNDEVKEIERTIINSFKEQFIKHVDGLEYFEGDVSNMTKIILGVIFNK